MNEFRFSRIKAIEAKTLQQRELLQRYGPLPPGPRLAHGVTAIVVGQRRFHIRLPARHIVAAQDAPMALPAGVHHLLGAAEAVDRLGDKPLRPRLARLLDLPLAAAAGAL